MKYYITTFHLTSEDSRETVSAAADVLKSLLCDAGYEAFNDINDPKELSDMENLETLDRLNIINTVKSADDIKNLPVHHSFAFHAYIQRDLFAEETMEDAVKTMPFENIHINYITREAEDKNWNEEWEKEQEQTEICRQLGITIDVKQAFGTGGHDTTHMILTRLMESDLNGKTILDCGCGSGILSIAALKLGAKHATAYDIDEWSVRNTRHNAEINNVSINVLLGDSSCLHDVEERFDYVLANINRNILLNDMPAFASHLKKDGRLLLSGFYVEDAAMLIDKAAESGLHLTNEKASANWKMLELAPE